MYRITRQCACGRTYVHMNVQEDPHWCGYCLEMADLSYEEAVAENDKDDS